MAVLFYLSLTPHSFYISFHTFFRSSIHYQSNNLSVICQTEISSWIEKYSISVWQKAERQCDAELRRNKSKEDENSTWRKLSTGFQEHN